MKKLIFKPRHVLLTIPVATIVLILLSLLLGCSDTDAVVQQEASTHYQYSLRVPGELRFYRYKVVKITPMRASSAPAPYEKYLEGGSMCMYRLSTGRDFLGVYDDIDYFAGCNEFEIGDEVYLKAFVDNGN